MANEPDGPGGGGLAIAAVVGMVVCCALPILLVSGGLSAAVGWLFDGSLAWLLLAAGLAVAGLILWRRRTG